MDVWGPARVRGQGHEHYFLLVVDDYSRYTTVFPLRSMGEVTEVLIDWIRGARRQLSESFGSDLPVLRQHSDRGGEFSSDLLRAFCRTEGICQTFMFPASPQQNGIAEHRIGMVMDVARTSMIHVAAPHFLWPFAVQYAAHQINLLTGDHTCSEGDREVDKLSYRADVTFDESVSYYRLFSYHTASLPPLPLFLAPGTPPLDPLPPKGPAPSGVSQVDPAEPVEVAVDSGAARGAEPAGAGTGGAGTGGAGTGGAEPERVEPGGADSGGAESGRAEPGGAEPGRVEPEGTASGGAEPVRVESGGALGVPLRRGAARAAGGAAGGAAGAGAAGAATGAGGAAGAGAAGAAGGAVGGRGAAGTVAAGGAAGAGAAGAAGVTAGAAGGATGAEGAAGAGAVGGAASAGDAGAAGGTAGTGGAVGTRDPGAEGTGSVSAVSGGAAWPRPYYVPLLQQVLGSQPSPGPPPPFLSPPPVQSQSQLQLASPLPGPSPYSGATRGLTECREPESRPVSPESRSALPVRTVRAVPCPSAVSSCVLSSSLYDPASDSLRAASPAVTRFLATAVTGPLFESTAASTLVTELVEFAAACRLDYATSLVAESASASVCPPSVEGECALGTDVLEDRQEEFECFAATVPHLAAMDAEMASWKSIGTYVDEVPPTGANIVCGMWIFRVKRPPGSPPAFKARYVARDFIQRDYELHSLDFSTAFLQGSLHEEIWLRRPPGFTGSFPAGTQWSLRRPVYGLRQAPREWHDTLRTTLAALGFAPFATDPSLFLRTEANLPPFFVLVYVDNLVFATADTEALAHVKSELQKRHTCTDLEPSGPYPELVGCLMYLMTCTRPDLAYPLSLLARYVAPGRHRKVHWDAAKRVLRYLCSTSGMGLVLGGRARVVLTGHADASWVDDLATQRSSQGYTFSLGSGSVSWRSTRSSFVLSSSCEAEIYAGAMAAQELRWLTYLLTDLGEAPHDLVFASADTEALAHVKSELQKRHTCKDLGELTSYLCLRITRDRAHRTIALAQLHMVQLVLQRFDFTYSSPQSTPLPTGHSLSAPPSDESVEPSGPYPELVGCHMYLMTCTRLDLAYPLSLLARYVAPGRHRKVHWDAAKKVLRYLCSTLGMVLVLGGRARVVPTGHADASWVDDLATQRSSQGYIFSLGSGSVSWRSTRSSSVLSSSCEAEIYAGAMAAQELRWLTYLLTDLGEAPRSPPVLYVDNKAMLALCQEHRLEHRAKHIGLRYFLARELQQCGQFRLAYVATWVNTADVFTKAFQPCDHQRFCIVLGLVPTEPHLLSS
ncbi:unnamed protein product [Closterium sp. NIES-54]